MSDTDRGGRGAKDMATVLPFVAVVLLAPPVILIFSAPVTVAGIPLMVVYVFSVWLAVIVTSFLLSRLLGKAEPKGREPWPPDAGRR